MRFEVIQFAHFCAHSVREGERTVLGRRVHRQEGTSNVLVTGGGGPRRSGTREKRKHPGKLAQMDDVENLLRGGHRRCLMVSGPSGGTQQARPPPSLVLDESGVQEAKFRTVFSSCYDFLVLSFILDTSRPTVLLWAAKTKFCLCSKMRVLLKYHQLSQVQSPV